MNAATITAIIDSLPALIQLVQNMIADFNASRGNVTEQQIVNMQTQVNSLVNMANQALMQQMQQTPGGSSAIASVSGS